jgi:hypothetical protein
VGGRPGGALLRRGASHYLGALIRNRLSSYSHHVRFVATTLCKRKRPDSHCAFNLGVVPHPMDNGDEAPQDCKTESNGEYHPHYS